MKRKNLKSIMFMMQKKQKNVNFLTYQLISALTKYNTLRTKKYKKEK